MHLLGRLGLAALLAASAGCVPLSDYRALESRFKDQEQYVVDHKTNLREMERHEQVLTLRAREQERQLELLRTRLQKSETLRQRLGERVRSTVIAPPAALPASTPKIESPPKVMGLEVNPETQGLVLESGLMFSPGKAILSSRGKKVLSRLLKELNTPKYRGSQISVEGHTDDLPIKRSGHKSNWALSAKRSLAVLHFLEANGIKASRLNFAGFGQHKPIDSRHTDGARKKNRRVEIVLFDK